MSLLTICQNAMAEMGLTPPSSVVGNSTQDGVQLLALANRVGREVMKAADWTYLRKEGSFTLVAGTQSYALPSDFESLYPDTMWDRSMRRQAITPLTPKEWQFYKGWAFIQGLNLRVRIVGSNFIVDQTVDSTLDGHTIYYEYRGNGWVLDPDGVTYKTAFSDDADTCLHDEDTMTVGVRAALKRQRGLDWEADHQEYKNALSVNQSDEGGARTIRLGGPNGPYIGYNVPDGNFGV